MPSNVLSKHPSGPEFLDKAAIFRPEVAVIRRASSLHGDGEGLAWVSSANNVNGSHVLASEASHVLMAGDARPVLCEDGAAVRVDFAEGDGAESSRSLKAEGETADSAKEVEDTQHP